MAARNTVSARPSNEQEHGKTNREFVTEAVLVSIETPSPQLSLDTTLTTAPASDSGPASDSSDPETPSQEVAVDKTEGHVSGSSDAQGQALPAFDSSDGSKKAGLPPFDRIETVTSSGSATEATNTLSMSPSFTGLPPLPKGDQEEARISLPKRQFILMLVALLLTFFTVALDQTIVLVALPSILGDFGSVNLLSAIVSFYLIACASIGPLFGNLSDVYGRRPVLLCALVIFLVGSILCGCSTSMVMLAVSRAIQGIGGGGVTILNQIIFADIMTPKQRGQFVSITSLTIAMANVIGPLVGGFICSLGSWRIIFYMNIPIVLTSIVLSIMFVNYTVPFKRSSVDVPGAILAFSGIALILLSLGGQGNHFWESISTIAMFVCGLVSVLTFVVWEHKAPLPLIPLRLFQIRNVSICCFLICASNVCLLAALSLFTLYFQVVNNDAAQIAGLNLLPILISFFVSSLTTGRLIGKFEIYRPFLSLGAVFAAVGSGCLSFLTVSSPTYLWLCCMILIGLGYGCIIPVVKVVTIAAVPLKDIAAVSVTASFSRIIGGSIGSGFFVSLFLLYLHENVSDYFGNNRKIYDMSASELRSYLNSTDLQVFLKGYAEGMGETFFWLCPIMVAAFVVSLFARRVEIKN